MAINKVSAIINGNIYDLSLNNETGYYEADVVAPSETSYNYNSGHYYPITIRATDEAGNYSQIDDADYSFGDALRLRVKEKIAPTIVISNPTESEIMSNVSPTINWTITDKESGVNPESIAINVDDSGDVKEEIVKTLITYGYQCEYQIKELLQDGTHTVKIKGSDNDGNESTNRVVTFVVDTTPPSLSIEFPVNNYVTNQSDITVHGKTSDVNAGIEKVTIKLNEDIEREIEFDSEGNFFAPIVIEEGTNTIIVKSYDKLGLSSSITRIVTLDITAPFIHTIEIVPNPVSTGEIFTINVNVTD